MQIQIQEVIESKTTQLLFYHNNKSDTRNYFNS